MLEQLLFVVARICLYHRFTISEHLNCWLVSWKHKLREISFGKKGFYLNGIIIGTLPRLADIVLTQKKNTFESYIIYTNSLLVPSNKFFKALDKCVWRYASKGTFLINIQNLYKIMPLHWTPTTYLNFWQKPWIIWKSSFLFRKKIQMPLLPNDVVSLARNIKSNLQYQHSNK